MITEDLIEYIKNQTANNVPKELIISRLIQAGWYKEDVEEGINKVIPPIKLNETESKIKEKTANNYVIDPYHEPIGSIESKPIAMTKPTIDPVNEKTEEKISKEIDSIKTEISQEKDKKIWTPSAIKPIIEEISQTKNKEKETTKTDEDKPIIKPINTETLEVFQNELKAPQKTIKTFSAKPIINSIKSKNYELETTPPIIPKLIPKDKNKPTSQIDKTKPTLQKVETIISPSITPKTKNPEKVDNLSKIAMISSFSKDYNSANKLKKEVSKRKKSNLLKLLLIILSLSILGSVIFFFLKVYKGETFLNSFFIRKNPKTLLLNGVNNFIALKSYKTETKIDLSLPLLSNINSILKGEKITTSQDRDWFLFDSKAVVNKKNNGISPFFKDDLTMKSSLLGENIKTSISNSKEKTLFINIPNLKLFFKDKAPLVGVVSVPQDKLIQFESFLPTNIKKELSKIKFLKILPSNYFNLSNNISNNFLKNFIAGFNMTKMGEENIQGINTYKYSININQLLLTKFLNNVSDLYLSNLSVVEKDRLNKIFKATSINSFEVWIGKKDNNIYQYKLSLSIPLVKVIGLENKNITNKKINLDWQTTYYDFNIPNQVITPPDFIKFDDFIKNIEDINLKNTISSFTSSANLMKEAINNYGKKDNSAGSCSKAISGSLFSSVGHDKKASIAVEEITNIINKIITQTTSGAPSCYSTSKAWAISSPRISNPDYYFCIDSKGDSIILTKPITGPVCQ